MSTTAPAPYAPRHHVRFVTAASLFDGHDASINIMRRILQGTGVEVIHLGHNRSVQEVVDTAIEEDVQGIAVSSYQGGHNEYFAYMADLLAARGASHIKIFGGGGGVIVPEEIAALADKGVRIFSPEVGMRLGLQGMINEMVAACDFDVAALVEQPGRTEDPNRVPAGTVARRLTQVEAVVEAVVGAKVPVAPGLSDDVPAGGDGDGAVHPVRVADPDRVGLAPVVGITGTGGAGKSTLTDELVRRFLTDFDDLTLAVLSVDPTRARTGGALLGDRIRMNALYGANADRVYMRSFATRQANKATSASLREAIAVCQGAGFDLVLLETAGIGQSDTEIADLADVTLYVMTSEYGAPSQLEKIGMLDVADLVALNKFEKRGSEDALRDVRKQVQRNSGRFGESPSTMPVYPTMASRVHDAGVSRLYLALLDTLGQKSGFDRTSRLYAGTTVDEETYRAGALIPPNRQRYLADIADTDRAYRRWADEQATIARKWGEAWGAKSQVLAWQPEDADALAERLGAMEAHWWDRLDPACRAILDGWDALAERYRASEYVYQVRGKDIRVPLFRETLSGLNVPRVALPRTTDPGERLRFALLENLPGYFPYTAGVYPFKREGEDPTRMFAGEGSPERTNRRFHLVSEGQPAARLSTAFDSVTLYGFDPDERPDIYGKVGNAGVSVPTLDAMKKLYSGFDLCAPSTSVSMTINGPAPMILAMFLNTAVDQQVEKHLRETGGWEAAEHVIAEKLGATRPEYTAYGPSGTVEAMPATHDRFGLGMLGVTGRDLVGWGVLDADTFQQIEARTLATVRGTVQADILKEDQAQNTCIFSTDFALRLMGDIQETFVRRGVRNYYSVSISGYHIAEAGANPISQLAFTLSNGFTYVEYYLARGMKIDDFAPNLSFFFSNGMDAEYTVLGRVARRIWSVAMRGRYGANERSQMLKYHIQTSGRSLHAQEIQFNDIRTTLQALLAIYDNTNSLHTNAYDEAITTPTEESVRRAMAIQLIINRELGLAKNENPLQGSYIIDELTDLVEEAVLREFERISDRGGVLGAMETMYQRGKIQEESLYYEQLKHTGALPIVGVNTFQPRRGEEDVVNEVPLMRSSDEEKQYQLRELRAFHARNADAASAALERLQEVARSGGNVFDELLRTVQVASLGQITHALFEVGGQYRRSM